MLAKGKTDTGRLWIYVRDDRPVRRRRAAGRDVPLLARPARRASAGASRWLRRHPAGRRLRRLQQALSSRTASPARSERQRAGRMRGASSLSLPTSRRTLAARLPERARSRSRRSPFEVVRRIDALFMIERSINGQSPEERIAVRRTESRPLVDDLKVYMREQAAKLSRGHDLVKAIQYMLNRWPAFTLFLDNGRVCMSNNAAERGLRGVALGRKSWLFCGSDRGGRRAAAMYCGYRRSRPRIPIGSRPLISI